MPIKYDERGEIKRPNKEMQLTPEMVQEFIECAKSVIHFAENHYWIINPVTGEQKINLYDFQKEILSALQGNRFNILLASRQVGKALSLDTPILTPSGFTTMGKIEVGDTIYGADGKETEVTFITEVMEDKDVYEIKFDNGEVIKACSDHLWEVSTTDWQRYEEKTKVLNTKELIPLHEKLQSRSKTSSIFVDHCNRVEFESKEVSIDPYVLGVWLGYGNNWDGRIICHIEDYDHYLNEFKKRGYQVSNFRLNKRSETTGAFNVVGLKMALRKYDLIKNKHIPYDFIYNSITVRNDLLNGLMDTYGYIRKNGGCHFYQSNKDFSDTVRFLLSTMGIKSTQKVKETSGKDCYILTFATDQYKVFTLERKLERQSFVGHPKNTRLYIKSIKKIESEPVRCLQVNNEDHLFLCGKTLIPTHNTTCSAIFLLWYSMFNKSKTVAILANKADNAKAILTEIKFAYERVPEYLKPGIVEYNAFSIRFDNNSEIICRATSPDALRSLSVSLLMLDEFAFIQNGISEEFWASNYPTISTGGSIIVVSTPNGTGNLFYNLWKDAIDEKNSFYPLEVRWDRHPDRDEEWMRETIKNIGKIRFQQEYNCSFFGSSVTLIDGAFIVSSLKSQDPIRETEYKKYWKDPVFNRKYAIAIDVSQGVGSDFSVANVFDITDGPDKVEQVCCYRRNDVNVPEFTEIVYNLGIEWNNAYLIIETNANLGEELQRTLFESPYEYENLFFDYDRAKHGVFATRGNKPAACSWFKELLENKNITIYDENLITEIGYFEEIRENVFKARPGKNCFDDIVMTCIWLSYFLKSKYFEDIKDSWQYEEVSSEEVEDKDVYEKWQDFLQTDYEEVEDNWLDKDINGNGSDDSGMVWW